MHNARKFNLIGAKKESQRLLILEKSHDSKTAGHFRFVKMLHLIKCQFWWLSLKKDSQKLRGYLPSLCFGQTEQGKPVVEPNTPWKEISMDFIVELSESSGNTIIWVITDLFSKEMHFVPSQKILSARTLAYLFIHHIYRLQGILSNNF